MSLSNYLLDLYTSVPYPLCWDWVSATVACLSDVSAWRYLNIGSQGCHQTWAPPRSQQRILGHLAKCTYINVKLRQKVIEELGSKAIGPATDEMLVKVLSQDSTGAAIEEIKPLNLTKKGKGNGTLMAFATNGGRKKQKEECNYHLMRCIVCCGIPPTIINLEEWKEMMAALNPYYHPPSSTTLTEKLIVNEAAKLTAAVGKLLSTCQNLTITFDGGKIRRPKSTYSVHVTTATHHADDASQLSHTANYILEVLERVSVSKTTARY